MHRGLYQVKSFTENEAGVTSIEYALIAALIAMVIVISVGLAGDALKDLYDDIAAKVVDAIQ